MIERDPNIIHSGLSRTVKRDGADGRRRRDAGVPRQRKRDPFPPVNAPRRGQRFWRASDCIEESVVCENTFLD